MNKERRLNVIRRFLFALLCIYFVVKTKKSDEHSLIGFFL